MPEFLQFLGDWTYYVLLVDLPKYMNDVLHVSVKENGFYSAIPWAMFVPFSLLSSYWCDWLISSGRLGVTQTRKLFVIICEFNFTKAPRNITNQLFEFLLLFAQLLWSMVVLLLLPRMLVVMHWLLASFLRYPLVQRDYRHRHSTLMPSI